MHAQANAAAPAAAPAGGAEWRARLEASHRAEAVGLAQAPRKERDPETGPGDTSGWQCPRCRAMVSVGVTVAIRHQPDCAVAAVKAACAAARQAGRMPCPPRPAPAAAACAALARELAPPGEAVAPAGEAEPEPGAGRAAADPAVRHRNRRGRDRGPRGRVYTSSSRAEPAPEPDARIRPCVVLRWFVSGCRVWCQGWRATVRGVIRHVNGRFWVWVDFDAGWAGEWCDVLADLGVRAVA